ncbi:hypothetical protein [Nocardia thraciensis]
MGFVIWYRVVFPSGGPGGLLPLRVSNGVLDGEFIADAEITLDMSAGVTASWFDVKLLDLPAAIADNLVGLQRAKALDIEVSLGYFDLPRTQRSPAMTGKVHTITSGVDGQGRLVTELRGFETAGYALLTTTFDHHAAGSVRLATMAEKIGKTAKVRVVPGSDLTTGRNVTLRARTCMEALRQLTAPTDDKRSAPVPVVIADGAIRLGDSVGAQPGATFTDRDNVVSVVRRQRQVEQPAPPAKEAASGLAAAAAALLGGSTPGPEPQNQHKLTVLGDPALRPGQRATYRPADSANAIPGTLRIEQVRHRFGSDTGYTCVVDLLSADPGKPQGRADGARGLAQRMSELTANVVADRPAVDVGEVETYEPGKHRATLHYGQREADPLGAASVRAAVDRTPLLHDKPVASPFAWHNVGLMVPVYPGMRALLAHNRSQVNDAVVAGYLWSEQQPHRPPDNQRGDWWLCLPTRLGGDGLPTGAGVNDLTDAGGHRVLQAMGLRISVGKGTLPSVGKRPTPPGSGVFEIEHETGTEVAIGAATGAVSVSTKTGPITLSAGKASLTLHPDGRIELSGTSISLQQGGA